MYISELSILVQIPLGPLAVHCEGKLLQEDKKIFLCNVIYGTHDTNRELYYAQLGMRHIFSAKKNLSHFTATDFLLYYNLFWSSLLGSLIYTTAGRLFCFALSSITLPLEKTLRVSSSYLQADPDPRLASTDVSPSIPYS